MSEELIFDSIEPIEIPVSIVGVQYVLREASGEAAVKYQNAVSKCSKFVDGKFGGIQGDLAGTQPLLISLCLFHESSEGSGKFTTAVPETKIRSWPARIQKQLYEKADITAQIAKLQKRLEELRKASPKNSPSDTMDGCE